MAVISLIIIVEKDFKRNVEIYESGLRISYYCTGIQENYNLYYNENRTFEQKITKQEVEKLFKELCVPVKSFEENYIIIPWEAVQSWKYDREIIYTSTNTYSKDMIRFNIEKIPLEIIVNTYDLGLKKFSELHGVFKENVKDKERDSYKVPISLIIMIVIYFIGMIVLPYLFRKH